MADKPKPTLLVVDDEEGPRASIRMVFKNDFNVHTFEDGDRALDFVKTHPVSVAILDIRMAGKSGIEVLHGLKQIDPHIQVIMLTAYETLDTAKQAIRLGAADYLTKPFDLSTIREAINKALHTRNSSESIAADMERLKSVTEQLNEAFTREELSRTQNEIYAGVIHDINNPLTIIAGFVDLLQRRMKTAEAIGGSDLENMRENLGTISKQVNTCCNIASRYLRFMSKLAREPQGVTVNQVLSDLEALLRSHPALKNGILVVEPLTEDATASINGTDLIQILINLTVNALQSTPEHQTVRVAARLIAHPQPIHTFTDKATERWVGLDTFYNSPPHIELSITDEGPGIPPNILPRIFESYFTTKEPGKGTGLGLSIVARLIKHSRGTINVRTALGKGTTFTVLLPGQIGAPPTQLENPSSETFPATTV